VRRDLSQGVECPVMGVDALTIAEAAAGGTDGDADRHHGNGDHQRRAHWCQPFGIVMRNPGSD